VTLNSTNNVPFKYENGTKIAVTFIHGEEVK
jgi:hypothetical protein